MTKRPDSTYARFRGVVSGLGTFLPLHCPSLPLFFPLLLLSPLPFSSSLLLSSSHFFFSLHCASPPLFIPALLLLSPLLLLFIPFLLLFSSPFASSLYSPSPPLFIFVLLLSAVIGLYADTSFVAEQWV
jgi:hypothetical protein